MIITERLIKTFIISVPRYSINLFWSERYIESQQKKIQNNLETINNSFIRIIKRQFKLNKVDKKEDIKDLMGNYNLEILAIS